MAKGNMLLGYSRGSVGDVVFYRDGGLQRTRARNRNPRNPKSSRQMLQRSLMANCVKFYKTATAGLFRFGFETKKYNESDYNAFVRVNIKRGVNISKTAFDTQWYGAIGNWRMTEGSLQSITTTESSSKPYFDFGVTPTESVPSNTTVGWLSSQLINGNPNRYMAGDIITLCAVLYNTPGNGMPAVSPTPSQDGFEGRFATLQFRLNTSDTREVADVTGAGFHVATVDGHVALGLSASESAAALEWSTGILGICCIQSRNTAEGTKVSTQDLFTNAAWNTAVEACKDTDYISAVLADWQAGGEAILQGGASTDFENPFDYATAQVTILRACSANTGTGGVKDTYTRNNASVGAAVSIGDVLNDRPYIFDVKTALTFSNSERAQTAYNSIANASPTATYNGTALQATANASITGDTVEVTITFAEKFPYIANGGVFLATIGGITISIGLNFDYRILTAKIGGSSAIAVPAPVPEGVPVNAPDNAYTYRFTSNVNMQTVSDLDFQLVQEDDTYQTVGSPSFSVLSKEGDFYGVEVDFPTSATTGWASGKKCYVTFKHVPIAIITVTNPA